MTRPAGIKIGRVGHPQGLTGRVRLHSSLPLASLKGVTRLQVGGIWLAVEGWGGAPTAPTVKLVGVSSRDAVAALNGQDLLADPSELQAGPDRVFYHDLVGLPVFDPLGNSLGVVLDVLENGPQDLLVISVAGEERLAPLQAPYVRLLEGRIELDAPPGLLDDEA